MLQTGGPVEMPWLAAVPAVLQCWYPGQEAGNAIADVLLGRAEPSGRLPQTFPARWADNATASDDPGIYPGENGHVRYAEGLLTGYRHHDATGIAPLFPFGHGLGYTTFELTDLVITPDLAIAATLTNTGARRGTAVAQFYIADAVASVPRAPKDLRAFARQTLDPGQSTRVTARLTPRDLAFYDTTAHQWRVEAGAFTLLAGFSATDIRATRTFDIPTDATLDVNQTKPGPIR